MHWLKAGLLVMFGTALVGVLAGLTPGYVVLNAPYDAPIAPAIPSLWNPGEPVKPHASLDAPTNSISGQRRVVPKSLVGAPQGVELPIPPSVERKMNRLVYSCYFLRVIQPEQEPQNCWPSPYPFEKKLREGRIIPTPRMTIETIKAGKTVTEVIK